MKEAAEKVMKRCQVGTTNYDDANNLHAECYGTIGQLLNEIERLNTVIDRNLLQRAWDALDMFKQVCPEDWQPEDQEVADDIIKVLVKTQPKWSIP